VKTGENRPRWVPGEGGIVAEAGRPLDDGHAVVDCGARDADLVAGSLLWPAILHAAIDLQGGASARRALARDSVQPR